MCFSIGNTMSKIIDPGGFIAEKTTPKVFAPYSGLHGTLQAMKALQPASPPVSVAPQSASQKLLGE